jgi:hypothetical protein
MLCLTLPHYAERADASNPPLTRVVALFAAYTFFFTQPFSPLKLGNSPSNQPQGSADSQPSINEDTQHDKVPLIPYSIEHILVPNGRLSSL